MVLIISHNVLLLGDVAGLKFTIFRSFRQILQVQNYNSIKPNTAMTLSSCCMLVLFLFTIYK